MIANNEHFTFWRSGYVTTYMAAVPAYFAKTAVVIDPLVYGFTHPQFRKSFRYYLANCCGRKEAGSASQQPSAAVLSRHSINMTVYANNGHSGGGGNTSRDNQRRMLRMFRVLNADGHSTTDVDITNKLPQFDITSYV